MCVEREPDRDSQSDDEQALEEIRQLFARYRQVARHGVVAERNEIPEASADDVEAAPAPAAR
jgi:hypothetical protein